MPTPQYTAIRTASIEAGSVAHSFPELSTQLYQISECINAFQNSSETGLYASSHNEIMENIKNAFTAVEFSIKSAQQALANKNNFSLTKLDGNKWTATEVMTITANFLSQHNELKKEYAKIQDNFANLQNNTDANPVPDPDQDYKDDFSPLEDNDPIPAKKSFHENPPILKSTAPELTVPLTRVELNEYNKIKASFTKMDFETLLRRAELTIFSRESHGFGLMHETATEAIVQKASSSHGKNEKNTLASLEVKLNHTKLESYDLRDLLEAKILRTQASPAVPNSANTIEHAEKLIDRINTLDKHRNKVEAFIENAKDKNSKTMTHSASAPAILQTTKDENAKHVAPRQRSR
jgi:hypothetical protein